jgi:hypothetical protein
VCVSVCVAYDFIKISSFQISSIYLKLMEILYRVWNFTLYTYASIFSVNGMYWELFIHISVYVAYDFLRFWEFLISTLSQFYTRNACTVHISMITTCRNIICVIVSYLCKLLLYCISCTHNLSKISNFEISNSHTFYMLFMCETRNF